MDIKRYLSLHKAFNEVRQNTNPEQRVIFDEYAIMCLLSEKKTLSATQIAREQCISCPTMTHRSSHLTSLGYLLSKMNERDHRRLDCSLTRKGSLATTKITQKVIDTLAEDDVLHGLSPKEIISITIQSGKLPLTADQHILLAYAVDDLETEPVMNIVRNTNLLQPTVSMALVRLCKEGLLKRGEEKSANEKPGYTITKAGLSSAKKFIKAIEALS
ncbi:MAG: hypothetical protein IKE43_00845 [Coriobacteriales bacterium]|nr:hypothetical protein [Coriobacteriales bacterium]